MGAPLPAFISPKLSVSTRDRTMRLRFSIAFVAMTAWPSVLAWNSRSRNLSRSKFSTISPEDSFFSTGDSPEEEGVRKEARLGLISPNLSERRNFLATFAAASFAMASLSISPAVAVDSTITKPAEFKSVGTQAPVPDGESPFVTLDNGVKVKDFRLGTGDSSVSADSRVSIQCSGRLLNLNGVVFYNTKNNNPDGFGAIPLTIDLGKGQAVPGLESGLIGMKKGGIRRIIVPQDLAYNLYPDLEPKPMSVNDQRALDSVTKNSRRDGAILFDVQVERFK